ncbi:ABC transporter substrate-binding protein [Chondrinema litorale]|uniref:ABC transporter substrate-binding protein n=1 Tax=Chondrinema litorale TaxID=2994555 RepID=UPI0025438467|nr:ABC transporter substrate-binding protein [Chondrinema litorale]UZR94302.1 ABC transporter substrate-binding protein [Chondrinema litorale]
MKLYILFLTFFFATCLASYSQSDKALFKKYEYGKSFLNNKQYKQAYEVFKSLSSVSENNRYRSYSLYFYALSAYHSDKKAESRDILFELLRKYPDWDKKDDIYYLLGMIDLDNQSYASGLENFSKVKSNEFEAEIIQLIKNNVKDVAVDDLEFLYRKYKYDVLGQKLFNALLEINIYPDYESLYEELLPIYGQHILSKDSLSIADEDIIYKDVYNVAVLLPLMFKEFETDSLLPRQQMVFDLYEGIKMAVNDLEKENIKLRMFAFDTESDSIKTRKILSDTAFAEMDLIIGPLYTKTISLAGDYAGLFRKVMVNPVSSNELIINGNPFAFLTTATDNSSAEEAVDYAMDSLKSKKAYIIYGIKKSEEDAAFHYGEYLQERGGEVKLFQGFENDEKYFNKLQKALEPLATDTMPHVYVSSSNPVVASNVISALQNLMARSAVFASSEWLNYDQFSYEQLERMKVHFMYPRYLNEKSYDYRKFRSNYVKKMNLVPSQYASMGYECMYYFGKQLQKYGSGLFAKIHEGFPETGKLYPGFDYTKGNDNSYVPILKFKDGKLIKLNSVLSSDNMKKEKP